LYRTHYTDENKVEEQKVEPEFVQIFSDLNINDNHENTIVDISKQLKDKDYEELLSILGGKSRIAQKSNKDRFEGGCKINISINNANDTDEYEEQLKGKQTHNLHPIYGLFIEYLNLNNTVQIKIEEDAHSSLINRKRGAKISDHEKLHI
jgi:hypothetical protein